MVLRLSNEQKEGMLNFGFFNSNKNPLIIIIKGRTGYHIDGADYKNPYKISTMYL